MKNKVFQQYLIKYAEDESQQLQLFSANYDYVVVIPACNENVEFIESVFSQIQGNYLIILVVNSPVDCSHWQENNQLIIDYLIDSSRCETKLSEQMVHLQFDCSSDVLLVDRNSKGRQLNPKHGVGLARKIGADCALKLYTLGLIKYPWIFSTDADVILPGDYFSSINSLMNNYSAVVLDFEHITDDLELAQFQFLYDFKMRYYLAGIDYAQVSYAYIPLGSALIASMESYAMVRGFPKKNAGEDFYLLNKLAKIKPIKYKVEGCVVKIHSRFSDRVPFGTGPALQSIAQLDEINQYCYYHPKCFCYLKCWKFFLDSMWIDNQLKINAPDDKMLKSLYKFLNCEAVFIRSIKQITSRLRWQQFVHQWFDAFRILKSVHFIDRKLQRLNYKELLKDGDFGKVTNPNLNQFIKENDTF